MPTAKESVVNTRLSGEELKKLILADCQRLVDNEGLLSPHIAFGRVGYDIILRIHVDNPYVPQSELLIKSMKRNDVPGVEPAPLVDPSPSAEVGSIHLHRDITSPNSERLREGMPIPVIVKGQDGTTQTEMIKYPEGSFPELGPGEIVIKDATEAAKAAWKIVERESQPEPGI